LGQSARQKVYEFFWQTAGSRNVQSIATAVVPDAGICASFDQQLQVFSRLSRAA
jgi:hypothetical protein